jgi:hypothetical protein
MKRAGGLFWLLLQQTSTMAVWSPAAFLHVPSTLGLHTGQQVVRTLLSRPRLLSCEARSATSVVGSAANSRTPRHNGLVLHAQVTPTDAEHMTLALPRRAASQRILAALLSIPFFAAEPDKAEAVAVAAVPAPQTKMTKTESGLKFLDIVIGSGREVEEDSRVTFHYVGRLAGRQGKPFEASVCRLLIAMCVCVCVSVSPPRFAYVPLGNQS